MKNPPDNDLDALSSGILGLTGASLLLVPVQLNILGTVLPAWMMISLGMVSFAVSLVIQARMVLTADEKRADPLGWVSTLLLLAFSLLYLNSNYFMEGMIIFFALVMQVARLIPTGHQFIKFDLLKLAISMVNLIGGIYLAIASEGSLPAAILPYKTPLLTLFAVTAALAGYALIFPNSKQSKFLNRTPALPWIAWCIVFIPAATPAHLVSPAFISIVILLGATLPWHRLKLPEGDILGHRVILTAATLEVTQLIFISGLLLVIDKSSVGDAATRATTRQAAFLFFVLISLVIYYQVSTIIMTIHGLMDEFENVEEEEQEGKTPGLNLWKKRLARYLRPFSLTRESIHLRLAAQADQIEMLGRQLKNEKRRNSQLVYFMELSQQLENQLDQPVAAQLAVNTLERALNCSLASLYVYDSDQKEFMLLASAGPQTSLIPSGYRQSITDGAIGRAIRQRKTQIINDISRDADYIRFENEKNQSAVIVPLIFNGHATGTLVLNSENPGAFGSIDINLAEMVTSELTRAWERSGYHRHLMDLVQTGSQLSSMVEPESTANEVASIARDILQARFTYVRIQLGQERNFAQSSSSGDAPGLLESLGNSLNSEALIKMAFNAAQPFRVRDIRKYAATSHLNLDHSGLRSMMVIPIRWHRMNIGAILAFGKQNEVFFTENDESLAELLSIQAAGAFESTWLQQELRTSLRITSLLYRLSNQIIQAENLEDAASDIAQTAHKLTKSVSTGIILLDREGKITAQVEIDSNGNGHRNKPPMDLINETFSSGQLIHISLGQSITRTCLPIQTPVQKYGAIWMDVPEDQSHNPGDLLALVNQAAIALERSLLLVESRRQAAEIRAAYEKLEETYDQTLAALMSALDARDRETEGHSLRVSHLVARLGETLGYSQAQLKILERGSLLHDIGKIGISDTILLKPGPLSEEEWKVMRLHPNIGAKIVSGIPFLEDTIPLIRHHQERWDGTGYPDGLSGENIPVLARIFAVVDAFDALTSDRPYRKKVSMSAAIEYLRKQSGVLFDPQMVLLFEKVIPGTSSNPVNLE
ncbi:MAG: GAF domain-containing protein [Chloroflexi bacterium]|nr:GAF domain-containing protein [Chloroflexota bacterium]